MARFEKISEYKDIDFAMPVRKTQYSAGYDFVVVEDIVIPSYTDSLLQKWPPLAQSWPVTLSQMEKITKDNYILRPTLVPTGIKCKLEPDTYLELSIRSSVPLKHWLIMANGVGRLLN